MSRNSKWKLEKTKVKVVFRLQFHATHIPQSGWDKLFISFIPADTGKPTAKTTKANVRNGTCKWADPIYETTRLLQDSKSKQFDEKLYKIVVAMGTSRASTLGEATINLADYVDALKPSAVTLPLHGCNFGTVLHITVQLLTSKTGFREFEQQRELRETGLQPGVDRHGHSTSSKIPNSEDGTSDQTEKVSARIRFKSDANELSSLEEEANPNEEYTDSATGYDGSSNTSGSFYAEKQEVDSLKSTTSGDLHMLSHSQSPPTVKGDPSDHQSRDNELTEENNRLRGSLEVAESSFHNLKLEVTSLQSLADDLGAETLKFSQLLSDEMSSSQELAKEVSDMKSKCVKLKDDIIRLKDLKFSPQIPTTETSNDQVRYLNGIAFVEDKIRELQKKTYIDGDTKLIYFELEALLNFLMNLKLGNSDVGLFKDEQFGPGTGLGLDLCQPESILQVSIDAMKGQIFDLVRELEEAKVEKEALTRKMAQMECYYEALIQELEENQKRVIGELQLLRSEHSTCLYTLSQMESMREDMSQQIVQFLDEKRDLEARNKDLERRASTSEAALRRARLNYSIAVDKLQKDLELLSSQVVSMFETNENLIKQALPLQNQENDDDDVKKRSQIQKRSVGGDILLEDLKRSFLSQEELYQKVEQELIEMHSINLNLDIYSKTLQESLVEASGDIRIMKGEMDELVEELRISTASQNELMVRLQKAMDDIHALNEYKSRSISQFSDVALQNQLVEDKLVSVSEEKYLLAQKLKDCESKYAACLSENAELSLQLKHEAFENEKLSNEMSLLEEQLTALEAESEKNLGFVQDKLANLLASYNKQFCSLANFQDLDFETMEIKDAVLRLEEIQHNACTKNCELMEENQNLKSERAVADESLSNFRLETLAMKEKFKSGVQEMVSKVDFSNALVDKLQAELESVAKKFNLSCDIEEKHAEQNKVLLADLALLENQMQELTCKILSLDDVAEEIGRDKLIISELMHDKQDLVDCLRDKTEGSIKLSCEIDSLKDNLKALHDELCEEKAYKDELEGKVKCLASEVNSYQEKLHTLEQQKAEFDLEKSRFGRLLDQKNVFIEKLRRNSSHQESELLESHDNWTVADVKFIYVTVQYEALLEELWEKFVSSEGHLEELQELYNSAEANWREEKDNMLKMMESRISVCLRDKTEESLKLSSEISSLKDNLKSLHDELDEEKVHKDELEGKVRELTSQLNEYRDKLFDFEQQKASDLHLEKSRIAYLLDQQNVFIEKLREKNSYQASLESELLELHDCSIAVDIKFIYVMIQYEALLEELQQKLVSSEGCLRELWEKYDSAEANWAEEKANLMASLDSLRSDLEVTRAENELLSDSNNEIKNQLEESQKKPAMMESLFSLDNDVETFEVECLRNTVKDAEEEITRLIVSKQELEVLVLLLKGKVDEQSASIRRLEEGKNELSRRLSLQFMKTEEFKNLSTHFKELKDKAEAEKREAEVVPSATVQDSLRIAFIKEQYETKVQELSHKLSISKKHGEEMLMKLQDSIDEIENRKKCEAMNLKRIEELTVRLSALEEELQLAISEKRDKNKAYDRIQAELECALLSLECCKEEKEKLGASLVEFEEEKCRLARELEDLKSLSINGSNGNSSPMFLEKDDLSEPVESQIVRDAEEFPQNNGKNLDINSEAQRLKSSMEHLHEELEKMKNENTIFDIGHDAGTGFQVPEREIMQLRKANEELRSMFPLFDEISGGGNALERVLALEIELAEALRAKSKPNLQFQSSFLKQHSDEEAVFKSFRDINELIREMLELKGRHASMEAELREMHNRYSQLSLQFAEVEGERQKLKMTLKNVRQSRKLVSLKSANVVENPSS